MNLSCRHWLRVCVLVTGLGVAQWAFAAGAVPGWLYAPAQGVSPDTAPSGAPAGVAACATCHGAGGMGRPDSAPLAGLPVDYFIAQMRAFRDGTRRSADPRNAGTAAMIVLAKQMTDAQVREAAVYFAALKPVPIVRIVEAETVTLPGGKQEPLGQRIVEVPDPQDPRRWIAYVPPRSLNRGAVVVTTGRSKTQPCGVCHGPDLKGKDAVPALAGRSPTYLMRQLVDMRAGARTGKGNESMKSFYAVFAEVDLIAVSAFIAARGP